MNIRTWAVLPVLLLAALQAKPQDTFSIVALDTITGEVGSAGASCVDLSNFPGFEDGFLGELFPGVGAINTQASYNQTNQINARNRMNLGDTPAQIIQWLVSNDATSQPSTRQYGITALVNGSPQSAAYTGSATLNYKNHITGPNYSIQGNILLGQSILDSMEANFLNAEGDLACKLMAALQGAKVVGADTRCASNGTSSLFAFIKVAQPDDTFGNPSFYLSLRTKNGAGIEPVDSLQTLFDQVKTCTVSGTADKADIRSLFLIYPNPAEDVLTVENKTPETHSLEISTVTGNLVYKTALRQSAAINTSAFQKGIYFIRIANNNRSVVVKMIKN